MAASAKEKNIRNATTAVKLAAVLRKFYAERKDGHMYSKSSLVDITKLRIAEDVEFNEANRVYGAQCVELKKQGVADIQTEHKPPIAD